MSQAYKLHEAVDAEDDAWEKIAREPGAATNLPILDLSGARDRSELKYLRLVNVGLALVPEDIPDLLAGVACTNVGAVLPVPTGTKVETRIGQTERSPVPPHDAHDRMAVGRHGAGDRPAACRAGGRP